jgi:hypothetical protein
MRENGAMEVASMEKIPGSKTKASFGNREITSGSQYITGATLRCG